MRIRTAIIGLVLFGQLNCSNEDVGINSFEDDSSITTLNGTWKVLSFEDISADAIEYKTQENSWDKDIVVTFNDNLNPKLVLGTVTTNSIEGEFEYIGPRQFRLSRYGTTFVGQPVWADKFGAAMVDGEIPFKINQEKLRIYYDNKTKSVTLTKE
jgi:hypothetical protein